MAPNNIEAIKALIISEKNNINDIIVKMMSEHESRTPLKSVVQTFAATKLQGCDLNIIYRENASMSPSFSVGKNIAQGGFSGSGGKGGGAASGSDAKACDRAARGRGRSRCRANKRAACSHASAQTGDGRTRCVTGCDITNSNTTDPGDTQDRHPGERIGTAGGSPDRLRRRSCPCHPRRPAPHGQELATRAGVHPTTIRRANGRGSLNGAPARRWP